LSEIQNRKHDLGFELSSLRDQLAVVEERIEVVEKELEEKRLKEKEKGKDTVASSGSRSVFFL